MRTSATGRVEGTDQRHRAQAANDRVVSDSALKKRQGFTLVELLMVVAILGLAAGAVVLSAPDPRPPVGAEAERFAARLVRAREEAVLNNRPVAVEATASGYGFSQFDGARWSPLTDGPFGNEVWREGTSVTLQQPITGIVLRQCPLHDLQAFLDHAAFDAQHRHRALGRQRQHLGWLGLEAHLDDSHRNA